VVTAGERHLADALLADAFTPGAEGMADMVRAKAGGDVTEAEALEVAWRARRETLRIISSGDLEDERADEEGREG